MVVIFLRMTTINYHGRTVVLRLIAVLSVAALLAAACGDDSSPDQAAPTTTTVPTTTTAAPTTTAVPTTAEELLAKALAVIEATHAAPSGEDEDLEPGLDHPPLRVEIDIRYSGSGLDLPDLSLQTLTEISAQNGRVTTDWGHHLGPHLDSESHFESLVDPAQIVVIDGSFYLNDNFIETVLWVEAGSKEWLGTTLVARGSERGVGAIEAILMGTNMTVELWIDLYTNLPGSDRYLLGLLGAISSGEIVGTETIGDIDTNRVRVEVPIYALWFAYAPQIGEVFNAMTFTGYTFPSQAVMATVDLTAPTSFDAWIDDEGRVHRTMVDLSADMAKVFELSCPGLDMEQIDIDFTITTEMRYLDEAIDIKPPPADNTLFFEQIPDFHTHFLGLDALPIPPVQPASIHCPA
ncbi:MAG: hypothetical protein OXC98_12410 [bacterium]|nr:hypothetical protein [Acidimicrobiia bacterium]MCY4651149.1 hypothetical protein [bacterium]